VDRVFLDANVLFSVAYTPDSRLRELWALPGTKLITSHLALEEALRNLAVYCPSGVPALGDLSARITITPAVPADGVLAREIGLADKDRPILAAAVAALCTHLLTGDKCHFGALYGRKVQGVLILTPAQYLRLRKARRR
jgi:predicted nucleic acid-binding protein